MSEGCKGMALSPALMVSPGQYPGDGKAALLRCGEQQQVWSNQAIVSGTTRSIALQLEWLKSGFSFVPRVAVELSFSGAPGTFEIDVEYSETDIGNSYVASSTTITVANSNNYARWDLPVGNAPKFMRLFAKTWPNPVTISAIITH
jgi:hypothetical protein